MMIVGLPSCVGLNKSFNITRFYENEKLEEEQKVVDQE